jgi:hypothetical protein
MDIHTTDSQVPEPITFETEIGTEMSKRFKSSGTYIPAEQIQAGGETLRFDIHELINSTWNNEELPQ